MKLPFGTGLGSSAPCSQKSVAIRAMRILGLDAVTVSEFERDGKVYMFENGVAKEIEEDSEVYCKIRELEKERGIQALGVEQYFECITSPFRIRCKRTGAVVDFRGVNGKTQDDLTATKGYTPSNGTRTLAMAILDEANEVKCFNHVRAAETTVNKFLLPYAKIVYAYNPPPRRTHWSNREFPQMVRNGSAVQFNRIRYRYRSITVYYSVRICAPTCDDDFDCDESEIA